MSAIPSQSPARPFHLGQRVELGQTWMTDPTPRQLDVVNAIRNYRHLHGYSPTMQELADELGVSKVTIFEHVGALEKKRVIRRDKHKARSIEVVVGQELEGDERNAKLPILGDIAVGSPIDLAEIDTDLDLERLFHSRRGIYALRVCGDSLIGEGLWDGDCVVVERRDEPRTGEKVLAILPDGGVAVKRLYREPDGRVRLQPDNRTLEPMMLPAENVRVLGIVISMVRGAY